MQQNDIFVTSDMLSISQTEKIEGIINYIERQEHTFLASRDGQQIILKPRDIIYLESVDGVIYIYTRTRYKI